MVDLEERNQLESSLAVSHEGSFLGFAIFDEDTAIGVQVTIWVEVGSGEDTISSSLGWDTAWVGANVHWVVHANWLVTNALRISVGGKLESHVVLGILAVPARDVGHLVLGASELVDVPDSVSSGGHKFSLGITSTVRLETTEVVELAVGWSTSISGLASVKLAWSRLGNGPVTDLGASLEALLTSLAVAVRDTGSVRQLTGGSTGAETLVVLDEFSFPGNQLWVWSKRLGWSWRLESEASETLAVSIGENEVVIVREASEVPYGDSSFAEVLLRGLAVVVADSADWVLAVISGVNDTSFKLRTNTGGTFTVLVSVGDSTPVVALWEDLSGLLPLDEALRDTGVGVLDGVWTVLDDDVADTVKLGGTVGDQVLSLLAEGAAFAANTITEVLAVWIGDVTLAAEGTVWLVSADSIVVTVVDTLGTLVDLDAKLVVDDAVVVGVVSETGTGGALGGEWVARSLAVRALAALGTVVLLGAVVEVGWAVTEVSLHAVPLVAAVVVLADHAVGGSANLSTLVNVILAGDASETALTFTDEGVLSGVDALNGIWLVTWVWVAVVQIGASVTITLVSGDAAAVVASWGVDALTAVLVVAVVGTSVALVDVKVAVDVHPSLLADAAVGLETVVFADTVLAWGGSAVVNLDAALAAITSVDIGTITNVSLLAFALVGSRGVDAVSVQVAHVSLADHQALVLVVVAEFVFPANRARASEGVDTSVSAETVLAAGVTDGAVINIITAELADSRAGVTLVAFASVGSWGVGAGSVASTLVGSTGTLVGVEVTLGVFPSLVASAEEGGADVLAASVRDEGRWGSTWVVLTALVDERVVDNSWVVVNPLSVSDNTEGGRGISVDGTIVVVDLVDVVDEVLVSDVNAFYIGGAVSIALAWETGVGA